MEVPKRRYRTDGEKSKWCINESLGLQLKPPMAALFMDFKSVLLCYCEHRTHPSWFKQKRYFDDIRQLTESPGEPAWKPLSQEQRPCHPSTCSWEALRRHTLALRCIAGPFRTTSRTGMVQGTEAVWSGAELTPFSLLYRWKERTSQYWRGGGEVCCISALGNSGGGGVQHVWALPQHTGTIPLFWIIWQGGIIQLGK